MPKETHLECKKRNRAKFRKTGIARQVSNLEIHHGKVDDMEGISEYATSGMSECTIYTSEHDDSEHYESEHDESEHDESEDGQSEDGQSEDGQSEDDESEDGQSEGDESEQDESEDDDAEKEYLAECKSEHDKSEDSDDNETDYESD